MEQQTDLKLGKEYTKVVYWYSAYLTSAEYIMQNSRLNDAQAGIKISRKNISNLRYDSNTTLMAESKEELKKKPLDEGERKKKKHSQSVSLSLCNPMYCSMSGSSIHGIFQARILGRVVISFSREYSLCRDWLLTIWATREVWVKEDSEKSGLKLNIPKTKITTSGPIIPWQTDGRKSGNCDRIFIWFQNHCGLHNHRGGWLQPLNLKVLPPWKKREVMAYLGSVLKSRDITWPTKVHIINMWFFQ